MENETGESQGLVFQVCDDGGNWLGDNWVYPDVFGPKQTGPVMHILKVIYILYLREALQAIPFLCASLAYGCTFIWPVFSSTLI